MSIKQEISTSFKQGSTLIKLIYINIAVFLLVKAVFLFLQLMQVGAGNWIEYIAMPANPTVFIIRPWTLFTYMFLHEEFIHIIFNLLNLYWFGTMFLSYFSQRQLVSVYIFGGIIGGFVYLLAFNMFPYFHTIVGNSILMGASASVLAIMFAVALYVPNMEVQLFLIGRVKLKYIALVVFLISLFSVAGANAGGNLAHLGGVLAAYIFVVGIRKGKDITAGINTILDKIVDFTRRKPKMKVSYQRPVKDAEWNANKAKTNKNIDRILDKIKQSGYDSLTANEKKTLFQQSDKNKW
jgi:membrane associated rhomboid family serine protease